MYGGTIPVLFLKEGDTFIWHSPVLDLSSCGATFEDAERNFREALAIFFAECIKHHTLDAALESYGWQKSKTDHAQWQPPHLVGLDSLPVNIPVAA